MLLIRCPWCGPRDETELANVEQMQAMAQSRVEQSLVALKTTLGLDLASTLELTDRLEYQRTSGSICLTFPSDVFAPKLPLFTVPRMVPPRWRMPFVWLLSKTR